MQELRAGGKARDLPGGDSQHAFALEETSNRENHREDVHARGGERNRRGVGEIKRRDRSRYRRGEYDNHVSGQELRAAAHGNNVPKGYSFSEKGMFPFPSNHVHSLIFLVLSLIGYILRDVYTESRCKPA